MHFEIPNWLVNNPKLQIESAVGTVIKGQSVYQGDIIPIVTQIDNPPQIFRVYLIEDFDDRQRNVKRISACSLEHRELIAYQGLDAKQIAGFDSKSGIGPRIYVSGGDVGEVIGFDGIWHIVDRS